MKSAAAGRTVTGLILAGALLRFAGLDIRSVWHDEAFGILRAARPTMAAVIAAPPLVEPPGWPLVLRGWLRGAAGLREPGPGTVVPARALSAVCGALAVAVAWIVLRELFDHGVALAALALFATSPFAILCAQQARPYALRVLLELVATALLLRALRTGSGRTLAGCALAAAAAGLTHYVALGWVPAAAVFLALRGGRPPGGAARWIAAAAVAVVPGAALAIRSRHAIGHATAAAPDLVGAGGWIAGALQQFGAGPWVPGALAGPACWIFAVAAGLGLGAAVMRRPWRPGAAALVAFGLVPPALLLAAHWAGIVYSPKIRYAAGAQPFLLAAVAAGVGLVPDRRGRTAAFLTVLGLQVAALRGWYGGGFPALDLPPCVKPHRDAAALIARAARPGDAVAAFEFSAYTPLQLLLRAGPPVRYLLRDPLSTDAELDDAGRPVTVPELARTARRIWLVVAPVHYRDPLDVPAATLAAFRATGTLEEDTTLPGIRVQRWRMRGR